MATTLSRGSTIVGTTVATWANTTNCYDAGGPTFGTWTNAAKTTTGTITIGGYNFTPLTTTTGLAVTAATASFKHYENSTTYVGSITCLLQDSAGNAIGTAQSVTKSTTTTATASLTFDAQPTAAQAVGGLRTLTSVVHNNSTNTAIFSLDYIDVTLTYTYTESGAIASTAAKATFSGSGSVEAAQPTGTIVALAGKTVAALAGAQEQTGTAATALAKALFDGAGGVEQAGAVAAALAKASASLAGSQEEAGAGIAFDAVGAGKAVQASTGVANTFSHTATAGADVFLLVQAHYEGYAPNISAITYAGATMSLLGSVNLGNISTEGKLWLYQATDVAGGAQTVSYTLDGGFYTVANTISYTGVGSVGTAETNYGTTNTATQDVTCDTGQVIVCGLSNCGFYLMGTATGGTNRSKVTLSNSVLNINDATAAATFSGSMPLGDYWGTIAVVLSPAGAEAPTGTVAATAGKAVAAFSGGQEQVGVVAATLQKAAAALVGVPPAGDIAAVAKKLTSSVTGTASGAAAVAYDSMGAGDTCYADANGSWLHTTAADAYVVAAITYLPYYSGTLYAPTLDTVAMTLKGSTTYGSNEWQVTTAYYEMSDVGAGEHTIAMSSSAAGYMTGNSISHTGVGSVGDVATTGNLSSSASQTVSGLTEGQMAIQSIGGRCGTVNGAWGTYDGGTHSWNGVANSGTGYAASLSLSSTDIDDTFTATYPFGLSDNWCAVALVLSPAAVGPITGTLDATLQPAVAAFAGEGLETTGTADATLAALTADIEGAAAVSWPDNPFGPVLDKLDADLDTKILCIGDSTVYGYGGDADYQGWVGRLGIALGTYYDVTTYTNNGGWLLYTGSGTNTITLVNAGVSGASLDSGVITLEGYWSDGSYTYSNPTPDVVFISVGINDMTLYAHTPAQFAADYATFLTNLRSTYPATPFIITTQNPSTVSAEHFDPLAMALLGNHTPLSPPLQESVSTPGVYMLDTLQAYPADPAGFIYDGIHPNDAGYQREAEWMLAQLAPDALMGHIAAQLAAALFAGAGNVQPPPGNAVALLKVASAVLAGAQTQTGTAAPVLGKATAAFSGIEHPRGALAATTAKSAAALTGTKIYTGTISAAARKAVAVWAGAEHARGGITATMAHTASNLSGVTVGYGGIAAALKKTTATLAGLEHPRGAIAATAVKAAANLAAKQIYTGALTAAARKLTSTLVGLEQPRGTLSAALKKTTASITGGLGSVSNLAATLKKITASAAGVEQPRGAIAATAAHTTAAGTGATVGVGGMAATIRKLAATLAGYERPAGAIVVTARHVTATAAGAQTQRGTLTVTVTKLVAAGQGGHTQTGVLTTTMQPTDAVLAGWLPVLGDLAAALHTVTTEVHGESSTRVGTFAAQLNRLAFVSRAVYEVHTPAGRVYIVSAESRVFAVPAENRTTVIPAESRVFAVPADLRVAATT